MLLRLVTANIVATRQAYNKLYIAWQPVTAYKPLSSQSLFCGYYVPSLYYLRPIAYNIISNKINVL